jgi:hypothetical protein
MILLRAGSCNSMFSIVSTLYGPEVGLYSHQAGDDQRKTKITAGTAIQAGRFRLTTKISFNFLELFAADLVSTQFVP